MQGLGEIGGARIEDLLGDGGEVGNDVAGGVADAGEHPGSEMDAAVGEDGVGAGHVDGGGAVGADSHRRGGFGGGDAGIAGETGYVFKTDLLGQGDGGNVERVFNGGGGGDHARVLAGFEVAGSIGLAVGAEVLGVVVDAGERGEDASIVEGGVVERGVVGGGVDERFEDGAGGSLGGGVVELGCAVVGAADEGEDLAGLRVEGNERELGIGDGAGFFAVRFADHLVDVALAGFYGLGREALELRIQRGVDAEGLVGKVVAEALDELIVDEVNEVGRFAGVDVGLGEAEGFGFGAGRFGFGDAAGLDHGVEDEVAALHGAVGMTVRIAVAGVLEEGSEEGILGEVKLREVFAEESLRGFADAIDLVAAAMDEVHLVGVHGEDLRLVEAGFELKGDHEFGDFAGEFFVGAEEEALGELLGEGGAAAVFAVSENVLDAAFNGAEIVDAAVLEEAAIFDGGDGLDEVRRDFGEVNDAALCAVLVFGEGGDELGLELISAELSAIVGGDG